MSAGLANDVQSTKSNLAFQEKRPLEQMKRNLIIIICFLITSHSLPGRSEVTQARYACNIVELAIWDEFLSEGKDLPSSWDDIPSFRDMKKNITAQNLNTLQHINALALVPNSPLIQTELGISSTHSNWRLFAISRTAEFHFPESKLDNGSPDEGRYAILVAGDGTKTEPSWIPETEAQLILKQIKGFDPAKQPFAFKDLDQLERDKKAKHDRFAAGLRINYRDHDNSKITNAPNSGMVSSSNPQAHWWLWIRCIAMLSAFLAWIFIRKHQSGN